MSPLSRNAISHFTHPAHNLNQLTTNTSFLCDGCKVPGPATGTRFTCTICDFYLHDYCATCPTRLTSTTNHQHPMTLEVHSPQQPDQTDKFCQICHNPVKGLAYACKDCNFWVHPLCVSSGQSHHAKTESKYSRAAASAAASVAAAGIRLAADYISDNDYDDQDEDDAGGILIKFLLYLFIGSVESSMDKE